MKEYHKIQTVFRRDPETRFKTLLEGEFSEPEFGYLAGCEWAFTEKVDGTNIRIILDEGGIRFAGKTDRASIPPALLGRLAERFPLDKMREVFGWGPICLYGEGYGAKIQKAGALYGPDQDFVLFDVAAGGLWLERQNVVDIAEKLGIEVVPLISVGTLLDMIDMVAAGFESQWGGFTAEGIVARPVVELRSRAGKRIITKLKHRDFPKE